jgi:hypothetical protein
MRPIDKSMAFRDVAYDALLLGGAIDRLKKNQKKFRCFGFTNDQISVEVALIKSRSLMDFLEAKKQHPDNLKITDLGGSPRPFTESFASYRDSVNKFSAHLTKERIYRAKLKPPKIEDIISHGGEILRQTTDFLKGLIKQGVRLNSRGQRYWNKLQAYQ